MSLRSFYDEASLWMNPSGYKDGKLYSQKPTDGDGDFTFSRGSNLAATRVDVDGLIEKGRENHAKGSNTFTTDYWGVNASYYEMTSGQAGYDGKNNAWLMDKKLSGNVYLSQSITTISGLMTASVYAKKGTADGLMIYTPNGYARWNLSTGTLINTGASPIDTSIQDVGNGWYRCSVTGSSTTLLYLKVLNASGADTSGTLYIQDAQVENGLVATEPIETTSEALQAGILEDMPRLDYSGGASCPSLLLEPQRTNVVTNSEYFDGGQSNGWTLYDADITQNAISSPDGSMNGAKILRNSTSYGTIFCYNATGYSVSNGDTIVMSCFVKEGSNVSRFRLKLDNSGSGGYPIGTGGLAEFNFTNGLTKTYGGDYGGFEDYGNGWYRVWVKGVATADGVIQYGLLENTSNFPLNAYMYMYGMQVESGSYPTSYIPTYGASVTRSKDYPTLTINSGITDSTEGSVVFDFKLKTDSTGDTLNYFTLNTGTNDNIRFGIIDSSGTKGYFRSKKDGTDLFSKTFTIDAITERNKFAFRWGDKDWKLYHNGNEIYSNTTASTFESGDFTKLESGIGGGVYSFYGEVNQILVFPSKLTDEELIEFTINGLKDELIAEYKERATELEPGAEARLETYLQELEDFRII